MEAAARKTEESTVYTYADYLTWDEKERIQIINGEAIVAQAAPSRIHQQILMNISWQLRTYLNGKICKVYPAPFSVALGDETSDENITTVVEPDITVVCDPNKLTDKGCKGAPDMVVEILSPSTARDDLLRKFNRYQQAGIKEYWVVYPESKSIQVFILQDGRYVASAYGETDTVKVHVLDACEIDLKQVFAE